MDAEEVRRRLRRAWSAASSAKWRADAPALGQCSVTALLLHDRYGAEILCTPTAWGPHLHHRVAGKRLDLAAERFAALGGAVPPCLDRPAGRGEAMADTTPERYAALARAFDAAEA